MATFRDPTRDIVRGLTSLEMTFVNISNLQFTGHADYIGPVPGITYADTIFPCFAFLSGMSATPARRSTSVIGVGLSLHTINAFVNGKPLRIPGVLQRLGISSLIANETHLRSFAPYSELILTALWYAITILGSSTKNNNPLANPEFLGTSVAETAQSRIDLRIFGSEHLHTAAFDPEGLLGSLMTAVSMLTGSLFISQRKSFSIFQQIAGATSIISIGEALHAFSPRYAPVSKNLWTPSFVLVSSGISMLKYVAIEALVPYLPGAVTSVLSAVGRRSLEIYVLSQLATMALNYGGDKSFRQRSIDWFGEFVREGAGDGLVAGGLVAAMAASAKVLVRERLRISI